MTAPNNAISDPLKSALNLANAALGGPSREYRWGLMLLMFNEPVDIPTKYAIDIWGKEVVHGDLETCPECSTKPNSYFPRTTDIVPCFYHSSFQCPQCGGVKTCTAGCI